MTDSWRAPYDEAYQLLLSKNKDYGTVNISQTPGGALNGVMVRVWDKVSRLRNLFDTGREPEHESVKDSFVDLLNYAAIALLVIDGLWDGGPDGDKYEAMSWEEYQRLNEAPTFWSEPTSVGNGHTDFTLLKDGTVRQASDGKLYRWTEVLPDKDTKAVDPDDDDGDIHDVNKTDCDNGDCDHGWDREEEPYGDLLAKRYDSLRAYAKSRYGEALTQMIEDGKFDG